MSLKIISIICLLPLAVNCVAEIQYKGAIQSKEEHLPVNPNEPANDQLSTPIPSSPFQALQSPLCPGVGRFRDPSNLDIFYVCMKKNAVPEAHRCFRIRAYPMWHYDHSFPKSPPYFSGWNDFWLCETMTKWLHVTQHDSSEVKPTKN